MEIKNKGQASITDALFFLTIVAVLAVLLFNQSMSYGKKAQDNLHDVYKNKYAINALKTMLNCSATRDGKSFEESKDIDYVLTIIKEEYYRSTKDNPFPNKRIIINPLVGIMEPYEASFDYMFNIYDIDNGKFLLSVIVASDMEIKKEGKKLWNTKITGGKKKIYVCLPEKERYYKFISNIGSVSQTSNIIKFIKRDERNMLTSTTAEISLLLWTSTGIDEKTLNEMNCVCYKQKEEKEWEDCQKNKN